MEQTVCSEKSAYKIQTPWNYPEENIQQNKLLLTTDNNGRTVFHLAAELPEPKEFQGIMNLVKENLTIEEVNILLLATDNEERTAFHVAADLFELGEFLEILDGAEYNLST
jgi:aminoglycoside N3'-acetyltransferase